MNLDFAGRRLALLVVDMQWVFLAEDGPFANAGSGDVVAGVNELAARCRARGIPVLFSSYVLRDDLTDAGLLGGFPFVQQGLLCVSAPEARTDPRVVVEEGDLTLTHNRPSAFFGSDLAAVLRGLQADALVLAGVSSNNAVGATARDAFALDLPVLVAREAVACAPGEAHPEVYIEILDQWTAQVVELAHIDELLDAAVTGGR